MLINQHCNGWLPELIEDANTGEYVHKAPNGTGYLCIQFVNGSYSTPVWTYAVMDNRNNAIAYEKISARDLADSHRRGVCSAAAAFFSLAYELWAREEVAATSEKVETQPEIQLQQEAAKPAAKKKGRLARAAQGILRNTNGRYRRANRQVHGADSATSGSHPAGCMDCR
jgi:hypothetical protein